MNDATKENICRLSEEIADCVSRLRNDRNTEEQANTLYSAINFFATRINKEYAE